MSVARTLFTRRAANSFSRSPDQNQLERAIQEMNDGSQRNSSVDGEEKRERRQQQRSKPEARQEREPGCEKGDGARQTDSSFLGRP